MKFGSSGILRMDLQSSYLSEVSSRDSLRVFYILGYIFQSDRRQVFGILSYWSSLFMVSIIWHRSKIYAAGSAEDVSTREPYLQ